MSTTNLKVRLTPQENLLITNYRVFQGSGVRLNDLFDVDTTGAITGSVLTYDGTATQWVAANEIKSTNVSIDGGEF